MTCLLDDTTLGYMNVGLWTRAHFPAGTVIGGLQCGDGVLRGQSRLVNLDGVVCWQTTWRSASTGSPITFAGGDPP
jgi:hypothetical protein